MRRRGAVRAAHPHLADLAGRDFLAIRPEDAHRLIMVGTTYSHAARCCSTSRSVSSASKPRTAGLTAAEVSAGAALDLLEITPDGRATAGQLPAGPAGPGAARAPAAWYLARRGLQG